MTAPSDLPSKEDVAGPCERPASPAESGVCEPSLGAALYCWSDARREGTRWIWQPLVCHGLDAAACADVRFERENESTRRRLAELLGLEWALARPWLLLLVACHDIGKACPGFQARWRNLTGIDRGRQPYTAVEPAFVGQVALRELLQGRGWAPALAASLTDAVVCHRGPRAFAETLDAIRADERSVGGDGWAQARRSLFDVCFSVFRPPLPPPLRETEAHNLPLLSDAVLRADDMASDENCFPFPNAVDLHYFEGWFKRSLRRADACIGGTGTSPG